MGVAFPRPSGWPEVAENILKIFIDHILFICKNEKIPHLNMNMSNTHQNLVDSDSCDCTLYDYELVIYSSKYGIIGIIT